MPEPSPVIESTQLQAEVVGVLVVVFTREHGKTKPVQRVAPIEPAGQRKLMNFIKHKLHGGVLRLAEAPPEEKRIITL
jgi:hypothetical protein